MNTSVYYAYSFILATIVHGGIIALMLANWSSVQTVVHTDDKLYYIEASVVHENPNKARGKKEQRAADKRKITRQKRLAAKDAKRAAKIKQERLAIEALKTQMELKAIEDAEKALLADLIDKQLLEDENAKSLEDDRKLMAAALDLAVMDEQLVLRAITDDEKAKAFVGQIQRDIIQKWSRPPSARNGMQVILRVFLVPTGEVVSVTVDESSGNEAFDRSAILAVDKVGRFIVPTEPRQFEKNFRQFVVLFRPEDLRL